MPVPDGKVSAWFGEVTWFVFPAGWEAESYSKKFSYLPFGQHFDPIMYFKP